MKHYIITFIAICIICATAVYTYECNKQVNKIMTTYKMNTGAFNRQRDEMQGEIRSYKRWCL